MTAALPRSTTISGRALAVLGALAVAFGAAFVLAPGTLAALRPGGGFADQPAIVNALRPAFVEYWHSGSRSFPPDLANIVGYWSGYHVVKAVTAALLLIVLVVLGARLGKALLRAGEQGVGRRAALVVAWLFVALLALLSAALVMANVQGTLAPFSSLSTMLPLGQLTGVVDQIRQQLADHASNPALAVMVDDFAWYHMVIAVLAPLVALVLTGMSVVAWRRFAKTESADRWRRVLGWFGILCALAALAVFVVAAANVSVVADPAPALLGFFNGDF